MDRCSTAPFHVACAAIVTTMPPGDGVTSVRCSVAGSGDPSASGMVVSIDAGAKLACSYLTRLRAVRISRCSAASNAVRAGSAPKCALAVMAAESAAPSTRTTMAVATIVSIIAWPR